MGGAPGSLQAVQDGNLHDHKVGAAVPVGDNSFVMDPWCSQQSENTSRTTTTRLAFEPLELLAKSVSASVNS